MINVHVKWFQTEVLEKFPLSLNNRNNSIGEEDIESKT
jgi:hypothetical protein